MQRLLVDAGCDLHGGTNATVGELLEQFMLTATLAPTTRQDWESVIARHLLPVLGERVLWRLTARDCDGLYAAMLANGSGPSRVSCGTAPMSFCTALSPRLCAGVGSLATR